MAKILNVQIGESWIRVGVASANNKNGNAGKLFRFLLPGNMVDDGYVQNSAMVGELLKKELSKNNLASVKKAIFTVFSSKIITRETMVPFMKQSLLQGMLETNATEYFPIDISDYILSYQILGIETHESMKQYRLLMYASPKSLAASCQAVAKAAGIEAVKLDYLGNSVFQACAAVNKQNLHMNILVEEYNTIVTIVENGKMALQRNVTQGLDGAFEAAGRHAVLSEGADKDKLLEIFRSKLCIRNRKNDFFTEDKFENACDDVTDSLQYLCGNISRILDYYVSRNQEAIFSSVTLAGLGAECRGLAELLSEELSLEVTLASILPAGSAKQVVFEQDEPEAAYFAVIGSSIAPVDLKEKTEPKMRFKPTGESLKGAFIILWVALGVSVALSATGIIYNVSQKMEQKKLETQIASLQPVQELYDKYVKFKKEHEDFLNMYEYTKTPNEDLLKLVEEMEDKLPSGSMVSALNVTGTTVSMSMSAGSKEEASKTLMQLRTFESLTNVQSLGLTEDENGKVTYEITAFYANPAKTDQPPADGQVPLEGEAQTEAVIEESSAQE